MKKLNLVTLGFIAITTLQGCTSFQKPQSVLTPKNTSEKTAIAQPAAPDKSTQLPFLQRCLKNVNILVKLNSKYQAEQQELNTLINDAKFYAAFSDTTSENVRLTVTPLFEYRLNDKCNTISQLLINEFKLKIKNSESFNGIRP